MQLLTDRSSILGERSHDPRIFPEIYEQSGLGIGRLLFWRSAEVVTFYDVQRHFVREGN